MNSSVDFISNQQGLQPHPTQSTIACQRPACCSCVIIEERPLSFLKDKGRPDGESGIRTHGDISATLDFESSALDQLSHLSNACLRGIFCLESA